MNPLYLKVKSDLLEKITSGFYKEGDLIPTEHELSDIYSVSRPTVRQAIQLLVDDGYLEKRKKRGTIVCARKIQQRFTQIISSFDKEMSSKGLISKTKVLSFKLEKPNIKVIDKLGLDEKDMVFKLIRLRYSDEQPNVLVTTFIPQKLFPSLIDVDFNTNSLYETFDKLGNPISRIFRKLETIKADETVADLLDIEIGDPIFYFKSVGLNNKGKAIEFSISKYRGDINSFTFEITNKLI